MIDPDSPAWEDVNIRLCLSLEVSMRESNITNFAYPNRLAIPILESHQNTWPSIGCVLSEVQGNTHVA